MAEWSKAADLRSAIFGCVGSNPTLINLFLYLLNIKLTYYTTTNHPFFISYF